MVSCCTPPVTQRVVLQTGEKMELGVEGWGRVESESWQKQKLPNSIK